MEPNTAAGLIRDYQMLMSSPGNDVCDYHDAGYPSYPMGVPK